MAAASPDLNEYVGSGDIEKSGESVHVPDSNTRRLQLALKNGVQRSDAMKKRHAELMSNTHYARVITESHAVFSALDKVPIPPGTDTKGQIEHMATLTSAAHKYSVIIRSAVTTLQKAPSGTDKKVLTCLQGRDLLWGLMQFVAAFHDKRDHEVAIYLAIWGRSIVINEAADVYTAVLNPLDDTPLTENNQLYWNAVIFSVLAFNFQTAQSLIRAHTKVQTDYAVGKMMLVFDSLHRIFMDPSGFSVDKFRKVQNSIRKDLNENKFANNSIILFIARLLCGEDDAYKQACQELAEHWCQIFPLYTIVSSPRVTFTNLKDFAEKCLGFQREKKSQYDIILLAAISGELKEAILGAASCFGDWWFSAHMSDYLYRLKPGLLFEDNANFRDVFLFEYAESLLSDDKFWEEGVSYAKSAEGGYQYLEDRIVSEPVDSKEKGLQLLKTCGTFHFNKAQIHVTRELTYRCIEIESFEESLKWSIKNGDAGLISTAINSLLRNKTFEELLHSNYDFKSCLTDDRKMIYNCRELDFFNLYYELLQHSRNQSYEQGLSVLLVILQCKTVPPFMYTQLLEVLHQFIEQIDDEDILKCVNGIAGVLHKLSLEMSVSKHRVENSTQVKEKIKLLNQVIARQLLSRDIILLE